MSSAVRPTVSVVMPTYNRADLLRRSVGSVLDQGFEDLELLIVDDGSTDDTGDVVRGIQKRDSRVRYMQLPENRGVGFARSAALRRTSGRYIGLIDSDDLWLPGKLSRQVEILEQQREIDILFGDFVNINHLDGTRNTAFTQTRAGLSELAISHQEGDLNLVGGGIEKGIVRKNFIQVGTVLLRDDVFERVGSFNPTLRAKDDLEFCWRASVLGAGFAYIDRPLVERHINESSITANPVTSWLQVLDALQVCRRTCRYMDRADLLSHISVAEHRACRNLMSAHSRLGRRRGVMGAYQTSLRYGFSTRNLAFFVAALVSPSAVSYVASVAGRARRLLR
jgi:glycosyltransferase involved in cell wall biosynthesis